MTGPPIKVDIVAGQNTAIPELQRTGTEIARVAAGATGSLSPVQKFSKALVLSEAREGTMALRGVRMGLTELAASATGTSPALARILEVVGGLGLGGPLMLAITGGIAAIAGGYALLTANARAAAAETKKLREEIVGLARATPEAKQLHRGLTTTQAEKEVTAAEGKLPDLERHYHVLVTLSGAHSSRAQDALKAYQDQVEKVRELQGVLRDLQQPGQLAAIEVVAPEHTRIRLRPGIQPGALTTDTGRPEIGMRGAGRGPDRAGGLFTFDSAGRVLADRPDMTALVRGPEKTDEQKQLGKNIAVGMSAALAVAGGIARGDAASVVGGLGGAASSLSQLKGLGALGPVGAVLSGLGGVFGLFGGGKQVHVMIDGYDSHAMSQQQQLMLALTGRLGLQIELLSAGGDAKAAMYRLGREARTDGNMRIPPGTG